MPDFLIQSERHSPELALQFLARHTIPADLPPRTLLSRVAQAFARLPYENLSKVVRHAETSQNEIMRRLPAEVLHDYDLDGAGGTCFSLTWTLLCLLRGLGFETQPILADRRYGVDTHSALVVIVDGVQHLLDPGYLLTSPVPMGGSQAIIIPTGFQEVHILPLPFDRRWELHTLYQGKLTYRLTYRLQPVDTATFLRAWDASFTFDMMGYPVLSKLEADSQVYLQKNHLMIRCPSDTVHRELSSAELPLAMHQHFGLSADLVRQALPLFSSSAR